jgi:hypothetical protein
LRILLCRIEPPRVDQRGTGRYTKITIFAAERDTGVPIALTHPLISFQVYPEENASVLVRLPAQFNGSDT